MIEHPPKEEVLHIIKEIEHNSSSTQRTLSEKLGISLGKTNYLLNALIGKGMVKYKSFSNSPGKIRKIQYTLTKKGFEERMRLMGYFLKIKEAEYNMMRSEWENLIAKNKTDNGQEALIDENEK